jgi:hypothetical protein
MRGCLHPLRGRYWISGGWDYQRASRWGRCRSRSCHPSLPHSLQLNADYQRNNAPAASQLVTPRSEPPPVPMPGVVTTLFQRSFSRSPGAFLGKPVVGAVLNVPCWFVLPPLDAMHEAAEAVGICVLQLMPVAALCATANASISASATTTIR